MMRTSKPDFYEFISHPLTIITILLATSLTFLFLPKKISNQIKMACVVPVRPIQWSACICSNSFSDFVYKVYSLWHDDTTKDELEKEVLKLNNKIIEQQDTIYKLRNKLRMISEFQTHHSETSAKRILADIIGFDTSQFRKSITVNAGTKHGVKKNDLVISRNALIGKIVTVSKGTSIVLLITDPASRLPGRILQTREQVIVEGNASPYCRLKYVPRWSKVKKGDDIVSSQIGSFSVASLPIATVIENKARGGALFQTVKALPKVDISKIESVLIIANR